MKIQRTLDMIVAELKQMILTGANDDPISEKDAAMAALYSIEHADDVEKERIVWFANATPEEANNRLNMEYYGELGL